MISPIEETTVQRYDLQFGTNVIGTRVAFLFSASLSLTTHNHLLLTGHWLFTKLLLPVLFAATDASPTNEKARVVTVSSSANYLTKGLDFEAFADGPQRKKYNEWDLYYKSKFVSGTCQFLVFISDKRLIDVGLCRVMWWWRVS